jgi:uncharacterized protein YcbK (DUF882 family)
MFDDLKFDPREAVGSTFERRDILRMGLGAFLAASIPLLSAKKAYAAMGSGAWNVRLRHAHTGETFAGTYRVGDQYLPNVFQRVNHFLRDFRSNEVFPMDPHVLDIVSIIQSRTGGRPIDVLSGYRCPKTNALLREGGGKRTGVAKNSFHMYGQAMDIRIDGYSTSRLRDAAMKLHAGGVGYYRRSDFVHVDTGTVRHW